MVNPNTAAVSSTQSIHNAVPQETGQALANDQLSQQQFRSPPSFQTSVPNTAHSLPFPPENLQAQQIHSPHTAVNAHLASNINPLHTGYSELNSRPNPTYMAQPIQYPVHSVPMSAHVLPGQAFPGTASAYSQAPYQHTLPPTPQSQINMVHMQVGAPATSWTTGLFDCMDDPLNVLVTFCFPCVTFGQVAEIIDNGNTSCATSGFLYGAIQFFIGCPCLLSCTYRTKLRNKFNLYESPAPDWITHFFCEPCALCQEYRELKNRGLDPTIGWQGNAAKWQSMQCQVAMMPPTHQAMRFRENRHPLTLS